MDDKKNSFSKLERVTLVITVSLQIALSYFMYVIHGDLFDGTSFMRFMKCFFVVLFILIPICVLLLCIIGIYANNKLKNTIREEEDRQNNYRQSNDKENIANIKEQVQSKDEFDDRKVMLWTDCDGKNISNIGLVHPSKPLVYTRNDSGNFDWIATNEFKMITKVHSDIKESDALDQLDSLVGLSVVKQDVRQLCNLIKVNKIRDLNGFKTTPVSYHCVFTGNPGTGKTTVARIIAEIYRDLGVVENGHLIETDRSGLVAEYVGQTAAKTNEIIDMALGGILFIDEAYSLITDSSSDFGSETVATLLKRMEDDRDKFVVILAGYNDEMRHFINSNPGLQSRFNRYINFEDYSADDLYTIFEQFVDKQQYTLTDDAKVKVRRYFEGAVVAKDKNFGNGRFVRNTFEKVVQSQADRLACLDSIMYDKDSLIVIRSDDIPSIQSVSLSPAKTVGFDLSSDV